MAAVPTSPRARAAVLAAGPAAAAALALFATGTVQAPDVEGWLTSLADTLGAWTYALVAALAFLETGAFVGLVAPGETAIVLGGVVAAQGEVSLPLIALAAWLAAALGDLVSFLLGRRLGRRFVGLVRAVAPFVAGASGLALRRFLPYSIAGTLVWATAFTLAGYAFHESFETAAGALTHGALALAVVAAAAVAVKALRDRRST
jgi:membrane-associated protein